MPPRPLVALRAHVHLLCEPSLPTCLLYTSTVHLAPIVLGPRSHVGTYALVMAGACVEEGAILSDLSLLSSGEVVPAGGRWSGSPARPSAERDPVIEAMRSTMPREPSSRTAIGSGYALGALFFAFLPFLAVLPAALLLLWAWERHSVAGLVGYSFLAGPVFVTTLCTLAVLLKRALVGSVPSGTHPLRSAVGLRKWLGDHFVFTCLTSVNSLFATLYTPLLLRGLGARIGRRSEVSTVAHIDSDCLVLDDECFIADLAALGPARQCNGQVSVARTYIGKRSFVGNAALVSNDTHVGARSLIGVLSTPPAGRPVEPETDWLGSPAIFLPRRQPSGDFPEQLTFRPRPAQVAGRLFIEFWRATLPSTLFILLATGIKMCIRDRRHRARRDRRPARGVPGPSAGRASFRSHHVGRLRHLHVRIHREAERGRDHTAQHHDLPPGGPPRVRGPAKRSRISGDPDLVRLLRGGDLANLGVRSGARGEAERR